MAAHHLNLYLFYRIKRKNTSIRCGYINNTLKSHYYPPIAQSVEHRAYISKVSWFESKWADTNIEKRLNGVEAFS